MSRRINTLLYNDFNRKFILIFLTHICVSCNQKVEDSFLPIGFDGIEENKVPESDALFYSHYFETLNLSAIHQLHDTNSKTYRLIYIRFMFNQTYAYTLNLNRRSNKADYKYCLFDNSDNVMYMEAYSKNLKSKEVDQFLNYMSGIKFNDISTHNSNGGLDGSAWILEINDRGHYKLVIRHNLEKIGVDSLVFDICQRVKHLAEPMK